VTNREALYAALFARLAAIPGLVTKSRILRHWADVPPQQQPALYMAQAAQIPQTRTGEPTRWFLDASVYLYVRTSGSQVPGSVLNPLLDAIEACFPLNPTTGKHDPQIPGIEWARIEGQIETDEGTLGEQAVAIIPIRMLTA
jgi:hypothetical protein